VIDGFVGCYYFDLGLKLSEGIWISSSALGQCEI